jgi:hypothetical protein
VTFLRRKAVPRVGLADASKLAVLTVIDRFSQYVFAALLRKQDSKSVASALTKMKQSSPFPWKVLRSDNGSEFAGEVAAFCTSHGLKHLKGIAHNPAQQGTVEGAHASLKRTLYSLMDGHDGAYLGVALNKAVRAANEGTDSRRGFRPIDLARADLPPEVAKEVRARLRGTADKRAMRGQKFVELKPGDLVKIDTVALEPALARAKKSGQFKGSHDITYSTEVYTVERIDPRANTVYVEEIDGRAFPRGACVRVQKPKDRGSFLTTDDRPEQTAAWIAKAQAARGDAAAEAFV